MSNQAPGPLEPLRIALAQIAPRLGDLSHNFDLHHQAIDQARQQQADLIVFPELSLTGYYLRDMVPEVALDAQAEALHALWAAAGDADLVHGFVEQTAHDRYYNTAAYASGGQPLHRHRKVYLPTYGLFDEQRYFARGNRLRAFATERCGRVGILICEDMWHVSSVAVMQAQDVDLLICISNSPGRGVTGSRFATADTYQRMCQTFAELLGAAVVFVNRVGFEDGLCFWGGSMVVGPDGQIVAQAPQLDPAVVAATLDRSELRRARILSPLSRDERLLLTIEELQYAKQRRLEE